MYDADRLGDPTNGSGPAAAFCLASRARAREACVSGLAPGVALLTGEAGSGKTWLWRALAAERATGAEWVGVDVAPTTDPIDLARAIARALGLSPADDPRAFRDAIADALWEANRDGLAFVLVLDELHNASDWMLEEVRVWTNSIGKADGFRGILLCGQTPLARRLRGRSLAGLDARLAARTHLPPIDLHEAAALLRAGWPDLGDLADIEERHRWSRGNPRRLLQGLGQPQPRLHLITPTAAEAAPRPPRNGATLGPVVPSRPPVQVEDGVVEVGWESGVETLGPGIGPEPGPPGETAAVAASAGPVEEAIHDPYATLQAWEEWTRGGHANNTPATSAPTSAASSAPSERWPISVGPGPSHVWAESEQEFSPYSDLFSRSRTQKDPE